MRITIVVGREKLLIGFSVSRSHSLLITHRNKHKSSSLPAELKGESPKAQMLTDLIYRRILHTNPLRKDLSQGLT